MAVYEALNWEPTGSVAVKLSTGEPPASNYLDPELIKDLIQSVDGTIVECNTAYGGSRTETAMHMQVAEDHGFTAIADVDILVVSVSLFSADSVLFPHAAKLSTSKTAENHTTIFFIDRLSL